MMIALLLATYNSGKYLREQLDSLFLQTYKDWTLYVHDDGSIDDTLDIVKEYSDKYPNHLPKHMLLSFQHLIFDN